MAPASGIHLVRTEIVELENGDLRIQVWLLLKREEGGGGTYRLIVDEPLPPRP